MCVTPLDAPVTYCLDTDTPEVVPWSDMTPQPLHCSATSQIFLGTSADAPKPSSETRGLILLSPSDLRSLTETEHTLASLAERGSEILLRDPSEQDHLYTLPVAPRWAGRLASVLAMHAELTLWDSSKE